MVCSSKAFLQHTYIFIFTYNVVMFGAWVPHACTAECIEYIERVTHKCYYKYAFIIIIIYEQFFKWIFCCKNTRHHHITLGTFVRAVIALLLLYCVILFCLCVFFLQNLPSLMAVFRMLHAHTFFFALHDLSSGIGI